MSIHYTEDKKLSWGARGLLSYLLLKPDNNSLVINSLIEQTKESAKPTGRDGVYSIINELIAAGYIIKTELRDKGKITGYHYEFKLYKREATLSSNVI